MLLIVSPRSGSAPGPATVIKPAIVGISAAALLAGCNTTPQMQAEPDPVPIVLSGESADAVTTGNNLTAGTAAMITSNAYGTGVFDNGTAIFSAEAQPNGSVRVASVVERTDLEPRAAGTLPSMGSATMDGTYDMIALRNIEADGDDVTFSARRYSGDITLTADFAAQTLTGSSRHIDVNATFAAQRSAGTSFRSYPLSGTVTHAGIEGQVDGRMFESEPTLTANDAATQTEFAGREYKRPRTYGAFRGADEEAGRAFAGGFSATEALPDDIQTAVDEGRLTVEEDVFQ